MSDYLKKILLGAVLVAVIALFVFGVWYTLFRTSGTPTVTPGGNVVQNTQSYTTGSNTTGTNVGTPLTNGQIDTTNTANQKIFKLADGPVEAAIFIQTTNPTTTLARYIMQDSGHVLDIPVNIPGAIARIQSNTTIPGLSNALWYAQGTAALIQYAERGVIKTAYLGFATSTNGMLSAKIRFLPDSITSFAASPSGKSVVYLTPSVTGTAGYIAQTDGTNPKKLFYSPLSQVTISWPATSTLLLQSKVATGAPGIVFAVSATTGDMTPMVYTQSLSATANPSFTKIIYQTTPQETVRTTYAHDVKSGKDLQLPFNPVPEKCIWNSTYQAGMYCAAPLASTPTNYLDLWHQGLYNGADSVFAFDIAKGITTMVALPGSAQGGTTSDIASLAVSSDGQYLLYITKGDRTLWGIRLNKN